MNNVKNIFYGLSLSLLVLPISASTGTGTASAEPASSTKAGSIIDTLKARASGFNAAHPTLVKVGAGTGIALTVFGGLYAGSEKFRGICKKTAKKLKEVVTPKVVVGTLGAVAAVFGIKKADDKWHFVPSREEATAFATTHKKPLIAAGIAAAAAAGYGIYKYMTADSKEVKALKEKKASLINAFATKLLARLKDPKHEAFAIISGITDEKNQVSLMVNNAKFMKFLTKEEAALLEQALIIEVQLRPAVEASVSKAEIAKQEAEKAAKKAAQAKEWDTQFAAFRATLTPADKALIPNCEVVLDTVAKSRDAKALQANKAFFPKLTGDQAIMLVCINTIAL